MHPLVTQRGAGQSVAVIPARWGASRFPGKPLADIDGVPMVVRVLRRVEQARAFAGVVVATDDERIQRVVEGAGGRVVMTSRDCASGTDRVAQALFALDPAGLALVVNVQGDEPLIDPADLDRLVEETLASGADLGTLARPCPPDRFADPHLVKVVCNTRGRALYFSRAPIPHGGAGMALAHVGIYAYRPEALFALARLPRSPLEVQESLEQLRALENGLSIHVARCVSRTPSVAVDVPEDVARVVSVLRGASQ